MNTKLLALPIITLALVACPTTPPTPEINVKSNVKVLATADVTTASPTQLEVSVPGLAVGDVVVSDFKDSDDDGILRRVTSVTPASVPNGVNPQAITKVYVKTESASLEDVFDTGTADMAFEPVSFTDPNTQTAPGIKVEAVSGEIPLKNFTVPLPGGVGNVVFNGSIKQNLDPVFKLTFDKGNINQFEVGLSGTISASLLAKVSTNAKLTGVTKDVTIASTSIRRVFLVGVVPVIVVIEPRMVVGFSGGADNKVTVEAGIAPTLSGAFKVAYNAKATKKWTTSWTTPKFDLNPSFSYTVPTQGEGQAYTKLVMDVKFYGVAGPTLETKPYLNLKFGTDGKATAKTGLAASGSIQAGINVLGKSMSVATDALSQDANKEFACSFANGKGSCQ